MRYCALLCFLVGCGEEYVAPVHENRAESSGLSVSLGFNGGWLLHGPDDRASMWGSTQLFTDGGPYLWVDGLCPDGSGTARARGNGYTAGAFVYATCQVRMNDGTVGLLKLSSSGFIYTPTGQLEVRLKGYLHAGSETLTYTVSLEGTRAER